jgi:hypothetical protein
MTAGSRIIVTAGTHQGKSGVYVERCYEPGFSWVSIDGDQQRIVADKDFERKEVQK